MDISEQKIIPQFSKGVVCFFTGNRPHKLPWGEDETDERCKAVKARIEEVIEELFIEGKRLFVCGMAKGGDIYFAEAVLKRKTAHPEIFLECALPCPEQTRGWTEEEKARYEKILIKADGVTTLSQHYSKYCMFKRNRYMADKSTVCVALDYGQSGGTTSTIKYAESKNLRIIRIN